MGNWLSGLVGGGTSGLDSLNSRLTLRDGNGDPIAPVALSSPSDVRGAFVAVDGGQREIRRTIGGRWTCLSCAACNHAEQVVEVIEEWAERGDET